MDTAQEKRLLRLELRCAERALPPDYRASADRAIAAHVLGMTAYRAAERVFCFVGTGLEIDTLTILEDVLRRGKILCVPLCTGEGRMEARVVRSLEQLKPGAYGIPEPPVNSPALPREALDFSMIPCLGCDLTGGRLGRGGGYYDRFFAGGTQRAAVLCRQRLTRPAIPREPHDLVFPAVVTEEGVFPRSF